MLIGFRIFALGLHRHPEDFEVDIYGRNPFASARKWTDEIITEARFRLFLLLIQMNWSADREKGCVMQL